MNSFCKLIRRFLKIIHDIGISDISLFSFDFVFTKERVQGVDAWLPSSWRRPWSLDQFRGRSGERKVFGSNRNILSVGSSGRCVVVSCRRMEWEATDALSVCWGHARHTHEPRWQGVHSYIYSPKSIHQQKYNQSNNQYTTCINTPTVNLVYTVICKSDCKRGGLDYRFDLLTTLTCE
jgi:hypothetical protein